MKKTLRYQFLRANTPIAKVATIPSSPNCVMLDQLPGFQQVQAGSIEIASGNR